MSEYVPGSFVPGSFPTLRATEFDITLDGGQFVFSLRERLDGELHEVGRYALPPIALAFLESQIVLAADTYERIMGHPIPSVSAMGARYRAARYADLLAEEVGRLKAVDPDAFGDHERAEGSEPRDDRPPTEQ